MGLFNSGHFTLHSGETSDFKIDCDFLSLDDLISLAWQIDRRVNRYGFVEGVPTGGARLALIMLPWTTGKKEDGLLILDDVYTTGASMEEQRNGREARGFVLFARRPITQPWIKALFTMEEP
jgi:orotate phosphoribosyltransferase